MRPSRTSDPAHLLVVILCFLCATAAARPGLPSPRTADVVADLKARGILDAPTHPVNTSILPAQICGIIGAYLVSVLIVGFFIVVVGRPRRRRAMGLDPVEIEMSKAPPPQLEPSPVSPTGTSRSWIKNKINPQSIKKSVSSLTSRRGSTGPNTGPNSRATSQPNSPGIASFDESVLQRDREERQKEMDRLYMAVMEHDAKQSSPTEPFAIDDDDEIRRAYADEPPRSPQDKRVLGLRIGEPRFDRSGPTSPHSPHTPLSPVRAIYPPGSELPHGPRSPTSPIRAGSSHEQTGHHSFLAHPASPAESQSASPKRNVLRRESRLSMSSISTSKSRKSIRHLRISGPIRRERGTEEERTPLSPRFYNPGPPPEPPTVSNTPLSFVSTDTMPRGQAPPTSQPEEDYADEELDQPAPLPRPAPHRGPYMYSPDPAAPRPSNGTQSASSSTGTLPFRTLSGDDSFGPEPIKTTYLERRRDPLTQSMSRTARTPGTAGMPQTPYTPYMPFTPLTPVTPHLVTKQDRKERRKWEKKFGGLSPTQEMVKSPAEMWESDY